MTVPAGQYLMMGDNRDRSYDSRFWGFVKLDQVEGRAMFIYGHGVLTANRSCAYVGAGSARRSDSAEQGASASVG